MCLVSIAGTLVSEALVEILKNRCLTELLSIGLTGKSTVLFSGIDGWDNGSGFQYLACVLQTTSQEAKMSVRIAILFHLDL